MDDPHVGEFLAERAERREEVEDLAVAERAGADHGEHDDAQPAGGRVVDRAMQIHGGMGMTKDLPLERWYREMRIRRVGEGPSEVQRMVIAREILGSNLR